LRQSYFHKFLIYSILQLYQNIAVKVRKKLRLGTCSRWQNENGQREGICQLEERFAFCFAKRGASADKAAFFQLFHGLGNLQVAVQLGQLMG